MLLRTVDNRQYAAEWYNFHALCADNQLVIVSDKHICIIDMKERDVCWSLPLHGMLYHNHNTNHNTNTNTN
jgi:protein associated with RNAse G/E